MEQHDYLMLLEKFFNKEASQEEIEILVNWIRTPGIRKEFDLLCEQMWKEASAEMDESLADDMWNNLQEKITPSPILVPKKKWNSTILRVAATILLPICIGLGTFYLVNTASNKSQDLFTVDVDHGQKANISLPDGTKVWLNSASHLSYKNDYNKKDRKINLEGEAYFEVAKDKSKRFIVNCNNINIEALGTKFDVKGYSDDATITTLLVEGSVRVSNESNSTILNPGEKVEYSKSDKRFSKSVIQDVRSVDFWRKNLLIFNSTTLGEIAKTIERMYGVNVVFDSEDIKDVPFTGTIRNSSLHNVFYIISLTYPLTYSLEGDTVRIGNSNH